MILTISNAYGSGALAIGRSIAQRLRYDFVDEQLPVVVAKRLQTSPEAVESAEDTAKSTGERMLRGLELGTPELGVSSETPNFDEECLREVQHAVREYAAQGNVVIFGRGAHAIIGRRADLLRIYLFAPRDWRVHHIMESARVDARTAAAEVDRMDRARRDYLRTYYDLETGDPRNYDLSIDTATFGEDAVVELVVRAVELRG